MSEEPKVSTVSKPTRGQWSRWFSEYGMLLVLIVLCVGMSLLTIKKAHPNGQSAGENCATAIVKKHGTGNHVLVVTGNGPANIAYAKGLTARLQEAEVTVVGTVSGDPSDARAILVELRDQGKRVDFIACNYPSSTWPLWEFSQKEFSEKLGGMQVIKPRGYYWPSFLQADNMLNVINNATIIAMIGIGMTMVIITAGIDLSVGSLVALAAVIAAMMTRDLAGGVDASNLGMFVCCITAIAVCGLLGAFSGGPSTAEASLIVLYLSSIKLRIFRADNSPTPSCTYFSKIKSINSC